MKTAKILIVDDETEIMELLEIYLRNEGYSVVKFSEGGGALEYIENQEVDLAILDIMLPDIDGFSLCQRIREKYYFPIIMLTARIEEIDKIKGITLGADDYITKPFKPLEVIARVKACLRRTRIYDRGEQPDTVEAYDINGLHIDADTHVATLYGKDLELTPIEFGILLYLAKNRGKAVSSEELFEAVWKDKYLDNNNTVFVHVARIREKMNENARKPIYIKTVWGVGYKL